MKITHFNVDTQKEDVLLELNSKFLFASFFAISFFVIFIVIRQITKMNSKIEAAELLNKNLNNEIALTKQSLEVLTKTLDIKIQQHFSVLSSKTEKINGVVDSVKDLSHQVNFLAHKSTVLSSVPTTTSSSGSAIYWILGGLGIALVLGVSLNFFGISPGSLWAKTTEKVQQGVDSVLYGDSTSFEVFTYVAEGKLTFKAVVDSANKKCNLFVTEVVGETDASKIITSCSDFFRDKSFNSMLTQDQSAIVSKLDGLATELAVQMATNKSASVAAAVIEATTKNPPGL
jgi:uncharacterized protein YoxC